MTPEARIAALARKGGCCTDRCVSQTAAVQALKDQMVGHQMDCFEPGYGVRTEKGSHPILILTCVDLQKEEGTFKLFKTKADLEAWAKRGMDEAAGR